MAHLILVRHGLSEWNKLGLWTGLTDVGLIPEGKEEAKRAAESIRGIPIDVAYTSLLKRAQETLSIMLTTLGKSAMPVFEEAALNERDYGIYTGKNKWQVKEEVGEEEFKKIRRGWEYPVPGGENLKEVYERVVPFYQKDISPRLARGENVLVVASGNSLRALVKYLEHLTVEQVTNLEFGVGEVYVYDIGAHDVVLSKDIRAANSRRGTI